MLVGSFADDHRANLVSEYDAVVGVWNSRGRATFEAAEPQLSAASSREAAGAGVWRGMQASETEDHVLRDSEQGDGLEDYTPLRFRASLHFDTYYTNRSRETLELLPAKDEAATATLRLSLRSANGSFTNLSLPQLPLVYDEVVHPRTPAPENRCRREHSGYWVDHKCHVATRLTQVCVQVERGEDGAWRFRSREEPAAEGSPASGQGQASFGCNPLRGWQPAAYAVDPCWGPAPKGSCSSADEEHRVVVVLRSAADPLLAAEELTGNSLDFGLSPRSKRVYGGTILGLGLFFLLPPATVFCEWWYKRRRSKKNDENVPLEGARGSWRDGATADVYGHSRV